MAGRDPLRDLSPPIVAEVDIVLIEPDVVAPLFQVALDAPNEFLIGVMAVAKKNAERKKLGRTRIRLFALLAKVLPQFFYEQQIR